MADKPKLFCNLCTTNGVKTEITFNPNITRLNKAGEKKQIPLDASTKQPHDCPFFKGYKGNGAGQPPQTASKRVKINTITPDIKTASIEGVVLSLAEPSSFNRKDGSTGLVRRATVGDDTGEITLTLWDNDVLSLNVADFITVENGFVTVYQEKVQISKGKFGKIIKSVQKKKEDPDREEIPTL